MAYARLTNFIVIISLDVSEEKCLGSILLPSYKISPCLASDGLGKKFAFKAEHENMKTYYFAADTKESMTSWMNALSLATIMQSTSQFNPADRIQVDGQEVLEANEDEEEEDSGFVMYKSRRSVGNGGPSNATMVKTANYESALGNGEKYPGSYNPLGLPNAYGPPPTATNGHSHHHHPRTHYVNAPLKPRRQNQYYDEYAIPPSAQYHQQPMQPAPDLIAHDSQNRWALKCFDYRAREKEVSSKRQKEKADLVYFRR